MPLGIDFSAIEVKEYDFITTKGKTYTLRDDVPFDVLLKEMLIQADFELMQNFTKQSVSQAEAQAVVDDWEALVRETALLIFRNTPVYADITTEELSDDFDIARQFAIVNFFSSLLGGRFSTPQTATASTATPTPNRATRRSQSAQKRR